MRMPVGGCVNEGAQVRDMGLVQMGDALMEKAVCETRRLLTHLSRGRKPDFGFILGEIYVATLAYEDEGELSDGTDIRFAGQFFLSTAWEESRPDILKYV